MSNEDNVVDLGDVTVPESKPQTEPQTAGPAPDEPSLEDEGNPWKRPSDSADMDQNEVEQARAAKKPRTEIMRDTSSKNRGLRMVRCSDATPPFELLLIVFFRWVCLKAPSPNSKTKDPSLDELTLCVFRAHAHAGVVIHNADHLFIV